MLFRAVVRTGFICSAAASPWSLTVIAAKAAIQSSPTLAISPRRSDILGPRLRGDDIVKCR
jgi:hypothetical protein